ncbi:MAG: biopolymer transporter ExbD [Deltaproteobacteria bacterium]|nr:biopolymer transporter ExbD [Deltaproteobacteria bacterium]
MGGGSQSEDEGAITGINVTPFVDIALVLLIIFMVTAKYIVTPQAIPVDLPRASTGNAVSVAVAVSVDASGAIFADTRPVTEEQLIATMRDRHPENPEVRAIIAADQRVPHGRVVHVIDLVRRAGVTKFAIQTQAEGTAEVTP